VHRLTTGNQVTLREQRMQVVGEVPQPAAGIGRCPLRLAEPPEIGSDTLPALTQRGHGFGEESRGGHIAVHEHDSGCVARARAKDMSAQP